MKRVSERVRGVVQRVRQLVCAISFVGIRIPTCWCVVNDLLFWLSFRLHSFTVLGSGLCFGCDSVIRTRPPMTQKPHCSQPGHDDNNTRDGVRLDLVAQRSAAGLRTRACHRQNVDVTLGI